MGITWHIPPFIGGFFMACSKTSPNSVMAFKAKKLVLAAKQGVEMITIFGDLSSTNRLPLQH
jgi:hypothetical protein